jgi:hypothetical protein
VNDGRRQTPGTRDVRQLLTNAVRRQAAKEKKDRTSMLRGALERGSLHPHGDLHAA